MAPENKNLPRATGSWQSSVKRIMTAAVLLLAAALLVGVGYQFAISHSRQAPLRNDDGNVIRGSLSERAKVEIGGIPQSMIIQSFGPINRVLLFLYGGPRMTEFFMEQDYPTGLERHLTRSGGNSMALASLLGRYPASDHDRAASAPWSSRPALCQPNSLSTKSATVQWS